jgi:hypothetical protein
MAKVADPPVASLDTERGELGRPFDPRQGSIAKTAPSARTGPIDLPEVLFERRWSSQPRK